MINDKNKRNIENPPEINPVEVVIREAKLSAESWVKRILASLISMALAALIVQWITPVVFGTFGVEANPNYGVSILIVLLSNILFKKASFTYYTESDENMFLRRRK